MKEIEAGKRMGILARELFDELWRNCCTERFKKEIKRLTKKYPSLKAEFAEPLTNIEINPTQGTHIGKSCYIIRLSITSKGKCKSGDARIITCVRVVSNRVYLLTIYDKSGRENIMYSELDDLLNSI